MHYLVRDSRQNNEGADVKDRGGKTARQDRGEETTKQDRGEEINVFFLIRTSKISL